MLAKPGIQSISAYQGGRPVEEVQRELGLTDVIKMASNENPLGPSKRAVDAMAEAVASVHFYPDGNAYYLKNAVAEFHDVAPEQLLFGNGSSDVLQILGETYIAAGDHIVFPGQSFVVYSLISAIFDARTTTPPLTNDGYDLATLAAAVTDRTAAIIAEPILGEGGIRPLSPQFAAAINDACARTGALYIADEVQTGLGRTGHPFYAQVLGLRPDLMSIGKSLGGGVPIGAALVSERVAQAVSPGDHGSTYGGNLLGTRAAVFVLDQLIGGLIDHVKTVGVHFEQQLDALALRHPSIVEARGVGVMRAIQLNMDAARIIDAARDRGLLVNRTDERVIRLLPALNVEAADIDRAVEVLDGVFTAIETEAPA